MHSMPTVILTTLILIFGPLFLKLKSNTLCSILAVQIIVNRRFNVIRDCYWIQ